MRKPYEDTIKELEEVRAQLAERTHPDDVALAVTESNRIFLADVADPTPRLLRDVTDDIITIVASLLRGNGEIIVSDGDGSNWTLSLRRGGEESLIVRPN